MKADQGEQPSLLVRLAAIIYFMGSSMLVQFTTKVAEIAKKFVNRLIILCHVFLITVSI